MSADDQVDQWEDLSSAELRARLTFRGVDPTRTADLVDDREKPGPAVLIGRLLSGAIDVRHAGFDAPTP